MRASLADASTSSVPASATMRSPSVLTTSASSTPATWTLVVDAPAAAWSADPALPAERASAATGGATAPALSAAIARSPTAEAVPGTP